MKKMKKVIIYSTSNCPYCVMAKDFLSKNNIEFIDYDVSKNSDKAKEMIEKSGQFSVPVIDFNGNIIAGFNKDKLEKSIKKIIQNDIGNNYVFDTIIIGAGPAGITAGIYLARRKLHILIIYDVMGGQTSLTADIENYSGFMMISGQDFTKKLDEHIDKYDINSVNDKVLKVVKKDDLFEVSSLNNKYFAKSIIIASGSEKRKLNIKGENELFNKGVTYCATCDAPLFNNMNVAIIGGGNSALEAALQLEKYAKKIYLLTINPALDGEAILIDKLKSIKNLKIITKAITKEIKGDKFVESLIYEKDDKLLEIKVNGIFIEAGYKPNSEIFNVKKNNLGEIIINEKNITSVPGVFAAGDVTNIMTKQIIIAAGEGAKAAISAADYLSRIK